MTVFIATMGIKTRSVMIAVLIRSLVKAEVVRALPSSEVELFLGATDMV